MVVNTQWIKGGELMRKDYELLILGVMENIENLISPVDGSRNVNEFEKELIKIGLLKELGIPEDDLKKIVKGFYKNLSPQLKEIFN